MKTVITLFNLFPLLFSMTGYYSTCQAGEKVRFFTSDWPVWEVVRGIDATRKLPAEFELIYRSYNTCVDRFKDGTADMAFLTLYDFIYTLRENADGVVIAATDYSSGGDKIMVRPAIKTVSDLKGKTWALQTNSISLWLANIFLIRNGLDLNDVEIFHTDGENVGNVFVGNRSITAAVGWIPNFNRVGIGDGKTLVTSADFPENIFDVLVVKRSSIEKNGELYREFLGRWFEAVKSPEVRCAAARNIGVSPEEFELMLENAHLYTTKKQSFESFAKMSAVATLVVDFFNQTAPEHMNRMATVQMFGIRKDIDVKKIFDDSFLR